MKHFSIAASALVTSLSLALFGPSARAQGDPELPDIGCAQENTLRSVNAATSTSVTFVNRSSVPARTYWLNYQGKRVFYSELAPGTSYKQQTFVTHPWIITNSPSGDCVALFQPEPFSATVVIR